MEDEAGPAPQTAVQDKLGKVSTRCQGTKRESDLIDILHPCFGQLNTITHIVTFVAGMLFGHI
jgi:hypothetical protein